MDNIFKDAKFGDKFLSSIEDRASLFCTKDCNVNDTAWSKGYICGAHRAYQIGAIDQRDIDIEKAWNWFEEVRECNGTLLQHKEFMKIMTEN